MAETAAAAAAAKRNTNTKDKTRKSKNEIIRSTLGMYLKQRNYSGSEKFRKSDLPLTQTLKQMEFSMMLDDDVSKMNSFLYSNVLCLSNNPGIVELQFSNFIKFVQNQQNPDTKKELNGIINPLLCHLYIELLKGRNAQPAQDFLKKFAHTIGPIDNLNQCVVMNKLNGTVEDQDVLFPSSTTQILFAHDQLPLPPPMSDSSLDTLQEYFIDLAESLSMCLRIEELDSIEITRNFHYSKFEMRISLNAMYALKHYLIKFGHVMILHILQTAFAFDIAEVAKGAPVMQNGCLADAAVDEDEPMGEAVENDVFEHNQPVVNNSNPIVCIKTEENLYIKIKRELGLMEEEPKIETDDLQIKQEHPQQQQHSNKTNYKLRNCMKAVKDMRAHEPPVGVFQVAIENNRLVAADVDKNECHLACGFDDSSIRLWQLNQSVSIHGRKPHALFSSCPWNTDDPNSISSSSSEEDDSAADTTSRVFPRKRPSNRLSSSLVNNKYRQKHHNNTNIFTDSGGISLRGHSKGVTDILFSRYNPLAFSVSKDTTMRAWRSTNYSCAAVYRGHNYPIWCVAESSVGLYMATGSRDATARLWSTDREFPLQTYVGHTQDVDAIAFHPNSNYIATGSTDQTVRLWCVTSGKLLRIFTDSHLPVQCVSFSPDGKYLAAGGEETKIRIFDLGAGSQLSELKDHSAAVTSLTWSSDSTQIASCCADGSIKVFNLMKLNASSSGSSAVPPSSSSSSSSNKVFISYATTCKRNVKTFFSQRNGSVSCIGSLE